MPPKKKHITKKRVKQPKRKWPLVLSLLFVLAIFGIIYYYFQRYVGSSIEDVDPENIELPEGYTTFGIDVSHHNGTIRWEEVLTSTEERRAVQFVYCKATQGSGMVDKTWSFNRKRLKKLGIPFGAYHFLSDETDPVSQAGHFLRHWNSEMCDLPPVLDVEESKLSRGELIRNMDIWLSIVEKESGIRPVIYVSLNDYNKLFYDVFKEYKFWIAAYSRVSSVLQDERVIQWQFTEKGRINGIKANCDFNYSKYTFD
jgi:lysozyme